MPLASRVLGTIRRHGLFQDHDRVAIALSGGSDSVALTWLLKDLEAAGHCEIAGLIHINHGLRGEHSDADEAFCRALAARLGVPVAVARIDVAAQARARRRSIEATARDARYAFFLEAASALRASVVATGHTIDDQAETVLLRLLRGAGSRGTAGIRVRRGPFVRPVLECRRAELHRDLERRGETFREDASNLDLAIPRNRIRHELLPVIARVAPGGVRALARFAALSAEDDAFLSEAAIKAAATIVSSSGGPDCPPHASTPRQLDLRALAGLPPALARRVVRDAAAAVDPDANLSAGHVEALLGLVRADKEAGNLDLPGLSVCRSGRVLTIAPADPGQVREARQRRIARFEHRLDIPGVVRIDEVGMTVSAAAADAAVGGFGGSTRVAWIQASSVQTPLLVRNWRPGDKLRPFGAPGRRKLQDVFVDRKIPRGERDRVPIVVDASGRIVWVAGVTMADECRVTTLESGVIILELKT